MSNIANTYDALQRTIELIGKHHGMRKKADGMNSTMPDDPSGDGFRDITTGAHYEEMTDEYEKLMPVPPDAPTSSAQALAEDNQQENSNSDFNVTSSGEGVSGQDYCKAYKEDPQGTDMPAEAGEEKYAEYLNYSFEENVAGFNKAASYILANAYAPQQPTYYDGYSQKTASAQLQQQTDYVYNTAVNHMTPLSDEDLIKTAEDVDTAIRSIYEGLEQEKNATAQLNVQDYATLQNMSVEELNDLTCRASDTLTKYAEEVAVDDVPMEGELGALQSLSPEELELLSQLSEEDLEELIQAATEEEQGAALESNPDIAEEAQAISDLPEEDVDALASMPEEKLASFIYKLAEDIADETAAVDPSAMMEEGEMGAPDPAMLEDPGIPSDVEQEIIEALSDAPPEVLEALDQMSPEELSEVIQQLEAIEGDDAALEEVAQGGALGGDIPAGASPCVGGNCAPEDEAINELSSAMTEEQVTPDELAQLGKEGSAQRLHMQKLAKRVKELRDSGRYLYSYPKTAKAAALRQQMHSFLKEVTRL